MQKGVRSLCLLLAMIMFLGLYGCAKNEETDQNVRLSSWSDFAGKTISAVDGTAYEVMASGLDIGSDAMTWDYYPTITDAVLAVTKNRADACVTDMPVAKLILETYPDIAMYKDDLCTDNYAFVLQKGNPLTEKINKIIEQCREDGTLDALEDKWFTEDVEALSVPEVTWSCENGTLKIGLNNSLMPMAYIKEGKPMGYEAELLYLVARKLHMKPVVTSCDFSALLPGVASGRYDIAAGAISITKERQQSVDLTTPEYYGAAVFLCRKSEIADRELARSQEAENGILNSWDDFVGLKVSDIDSSFLSLKVEQSGLIPGKMKIVYYPTDMDAAMALIEDKVDVCLTDLPLGEMIVNTYPELGIYKDVIEEDNYGFLLPKGSTLTEKVNTIIEKCRIDGTLDDLHDKWFREYAETLSMPEIDWACDNGVLKIVMSSDMMPMSYGVDGQPMGYEAELAYIIARELNMKPEVTLRDFSSVMKGVTAEKYDLGVGCYSITDERKAKVDMSIAAYYGATVFLCKKERLEDTSEQERTTDPSSWADFAEMLIAVMDSSALVQIVEDTGLIPGKPNWTYYQTNPDTVVALRQGKVDACVLDKPLAELAVKTYPELAIYKDMVCEDSYGCLLPKGSALTEEINGIIAQLREDGTLDRLHEKWFTTELDGLSIPEPDWSGENGTLRVATDPTAMPMEYLIDNQIVGYEVETVYEIAKALNRKIEVISCGFSSILSGVSTGKYDMGIGCISITEERQETMDMTESIYEGATVFVYKPCEQEGRSSDESENTSGSFFASVKESFEKTFIRENRWKMFLSGIGMTLLITILSAIFGSILGFLLYLLCKDGNVIANKVTGFWIWLVEGMPMVVLLMILFYLVFSSAAISGLWVSVIGFTMTFGASMFGMVGAGVNAVDSGQMEAALAMGYGRNAAFFRMILPQAARHFLPAYKTALVQHIKATSIVGYIAVQDLTKMSDIVRSRTYDAFFPLIATAAIYFALSALLTSIIKRIQVNLDQKNRTDRKLLKGVKLR